MSSSTKNKNPRIILIFAALLVVLASVILFYIVKYTNIFGPVLDSQSVIQTSTEKVEKTAKKNKSHKSESAKTTKTANSSKAKNTNTKPEAKKKPEDELLARLTPEGRVIIKKTKGLSPKVLDLALKAYHNAIDDGELKNHKMTIIDYSMPSNKKRMWVIDMDRMRVDMNTYVSHGARSGDRVATTFSNRVGSHMSSVGVMKTGSIYHGHNGMSLHLHGLEDHINDNVFNRHVVIHGSRYVNDSMAKYHGKVGRSFGCPAVDYKIAKPLIKEIAGGSLVFAYYPLKSWLKSSEYLV